MKPKWTIWDLPEGATISMAFATSADLSSTAPPEALLLRAIVHLLLQPCHNADAVELLAVLAGELKGTKGGPQSNATSL